jgi:sugar phosphate isomerase/epimerase
MDGTGGDGRLGGIGDIGIALQMWTVRQQMRADALGCIGKVAEAGYHAVELVGYGDAGFGAVRDRLAETGVRAISQHVPYRRFAEELDTVLTENTELGCSYLVIQQGRHEDWLDADAVRSFAATCNAWGAACREAGLSLGYHGYHELDQEFARYGTATRWDLFAELTDPELLFLQLDTYWVRQTGNDPAALLERFAGRVPTLHLKDTSPAADGTDTTVGDGLLDLPAVLGAAARSGTSWVIVEQEGDPDNAFRDIRRSRQNTAEALSMAA